MLADSDTGVTLLSDVETYIPITVEGNFYRIAGADSVYPFKKKEDIRAVGCGVQNNQYTFSYTWDVTNYTKLKIHYLYISAPGWGYSYLMIRGESSSGTLLTKLTTSQTNVQDGELEFDISGYSKVWVQIGAHSSGAAHSEAAIGLS